MSCLGEDIKKLGFGLMRLPKNGDKIDIEQTKEMVDMFMDAGFTYFDTAWAYEGSEEAMKEALVDRYPRESYQVATKLAAWIDCKTAEDAKAQFDLSLKKAGCGYFDFYLLHNLGSTRTHFFDDFDLWSFVQEKKAEGLIRHVGISVHCTADELEDILNAHPEVEFVQLQINYADWESPTVQSRDIYEVACKHNKPVIIMEPVKGGTLATPPQTVVDVFKEAEPEASVASWAMRFCADLDNVITVLSGMSNVEQMADNLSYMKDFTGLTDTQREVLARATEELKKIPIVPCTYCNYCTKVCPMEIGIPDTFEAVNTVILYDRVDFAKNELNWSVGQSGKKQAVECIKCGKCEEACPQTIRIMDELAKAAEIFGQTKAEA